jgi:hypothetical protein
LHEALAPLRNYRATSTSAANRELAGAKLKEAVVALGTSLISN